MGFLMGRCSLSVCLRTLPGITKFPHHHADRCKEHEAACPIVEVLPVLCQPAASIEPGKGALDDPSFGQHHETLRLVRALDDCHVEPGQNGADSLLEFRPLIAAIGI